MRKAPLWQLHAECDMSASNVMAAPCLPACLSVVVNTHIRTAERNERTGTADITHGGTNDN